MSFVKYLQVKFDPICAIEKIILVSMFLSQIKMILLFLKNEDEKLHISKERKGKDI